MGFTAGPVSFQRFYISGSIPADVTEEFVQAVNGRAFGKLATLSDDTQLGWIGPRHLFDTQIDAEHVSYGRHALLAIRIDRLRPPANVIQAYVRLEEEAAREAVGQEILSKFQRRKAREAAMLRAEQEIKAGGFRRMSSYPLLIDLEAGVAYLGSLGATVADRVMHLFSDTFGCGLEPADAHRAAERLLRGGGNGRALENLPPVHLVRPPDDFEEGVGGLRAGDLNFLGREFLSWLWYRIDAAEEPLRLTGGDDVVVMIDRTLRLRCDFGLTGTDVITAESPTSLPEARAALRTGKQPTKLGLVIGSPAGEFRLTLDGPRLAVSSLVLPESGTDRNARERAEERFELLGEAAGVIDALFELFLRERISRRWERELQAMSRWASGEEQSAPVHAVSA